MTIVARGLGLGAAGALVAFGLTLRPLTLPPLQPQPGGGWAMTFPEPVVAAHADELLLLIAAQIAIGAVH
jgi:hypothetical protein